MRFPFVARRLYDDALLHHAALLDVVKGHSVYLDQLVQTERARANLLETRNAGLTEQILSAHRHDVGLPEPDFDPATLDPMYSLGPLTQLAIEEFASGDPDMRKYLTRQAHAQQAALSLRTTDHDAIDEEVAEMVRAGDN